MDRKLSRFFKAIEGNKVIRATHISLFGALWVKWYLHDRKNPMLVTRQELMQWSKIRSRKTYYKCMNDLVKFGHIKHKTSFNPLAKSEVKLL